MLRNGLLALAVLGGAAGAARAQTPDERATLPEPRSLLFPRARAGWVPLSVTLRNPGNARGTVRHVVEDPLQSETVRTVLDAELEGGAAVRAVGYVWGSNQRWGGSQPATWAWLTGPRRTHSPHARLLPPPGDAWQVAVLLPAGPAGGRLPPRTVAALSDEGVRPGHGQDAQVTWTVGPGGTMVQTTPAARTGPGQVAFNLMPMGPGECPTHVVGWDACDLLLVSTRAPLDDLSLAERAAILQWVALGGVVLVDAGEPASDCERPLVATLTGGRPGPARVVEPLAGESRVAAVLPHEPQSLLPPPQGFEPLAGEWWDGSAVVACRRHGHGLVYWCGADLTRRRGTVQPDLGPVLERVLQDARARQARRGEPLGDRWPGQPPGEPRYVETNPGDPASQRRYAGWGWRGYGVDTGIMAGAADALHTGRARMPSPAAVMLFLGLYVAALGPGVWWWRRRWGGGLAGIPCTLAVALVFMLGAIVFGLATRGLALVTQRATFLWPVPGLPLAAESTWVSCFAGLGQRVTVRFPGQVAPLTVDRDGRLGTAGQLRVRFGDEATEAVEVALGAWQTRVLCAEGARAIGGAIAVRRTGGDSGPFAIANGSALPLGRGLLWQLGTSRMAAVPPIAAGASADGLGLGDRPPARSPEEHFGLPDPDARGRHPSLLALLRGARTPPEVGADGRPHESTDTVVYVAEVDPAALPGGGPTVAGERRLTDRVFVVVPVRDE